MPVVTLVPKGHSCEVRQEQTCEPDPLTLRVFKKNNFKTDDFGNIFQALVGLHPDQVMRFDEKKTMNFIKTHSVGIAFK